jgi:phosphoglucomutase
LGTAILQDGDYVQLTGNEVGILLLDFILRSRSAAGTIPNKPIFVKTIVSTPLTAVLAKEYGLETINVLTGFKFIGEQISLLEKKGEAQRYVFGYEESCGYLSGVHVRDKDAVNAAMLLVELAAECKKNGKTIIDRLEEIYKKFGYYQTALLEFVMPGASGMEKIARIMKVLRNDGPSLFSGNVSETIDYGISVRTMADGDSLAVDLPKSDVLEYIFEDGATVILRPSGTEPKLKVYLFTKGTTRDEAASKTTDLKNEVNGIVDRVN